MITAKRLYLYGVLGAALVPLLLGLTDLLRLALRGVAGVVGRRDIIGAEMVREDLSWALALVVVALPIWIVHVWLVRRLTSGSSSSAANDERASAARATYFFLVLAATGIVAGECSSAALWPLAACQKRLVTRYSVLLFHPMKWQSEENVGLAEASEWARHFGQLETDMDRLLVDLLGTTAEKIAEWSSPGRYVSGPELAEAGLAELVELAPLESLLPKPKRGMGLKG